MKALELRAKGAAAKEVSAATGLHAAYVTQLVAKYRKKGLEAISGNHYGGNHRNMSVEEEAGILAPFKARAEKGETAQLDENLIHDLLIAERKGTQRQGCFSVRNLICHAKALSYLTEQEKAWYNARRTWMQKISGGEVKVLWSSEPTLMRYMRNMSWETALH